MSVVAAKPASNKVLVLATESCAYPGADTVGQAHIDYPSNVYVFRAPAPVLFPADFFFRCFEKGIGGIIIMACGTDCPYEGAYSRLAQRIDGMYSTLNGRGIDPRRIRLTSICTVCAGAFLREVNQMNGLLQELGAN
jgi:F420-non-reducing hydrogenase iron-sulfur subunit